MQSSRTQASGSGGSTPGLADELDLRLTRFGTRIGTVNRFLNGLKVDRPVWRTNWSVSFSGSLEPDVMRYILNPDKRRRVFPGSEPPGDWGDGADGAVKLLDSRGVADSLFVKVEYQVRSPVPACAPPRPAHLCTGSPLSGPPPAARALGVRAVRRQDLPRAFQCAQEHAVRGREPRHQRPTRNRDAFPRLQGP